MRAPRAAGFGAMLLWITVSSPAEAKILEEREVGSWRLTAFSSESEKYKFCDASGPLNQDTLLGIVLTPSRDWYLSLSDDTLEFVEGQVYPLVYAIDDGRPVNAEAHAISTTILWIPVGNGDTAMDPLRRGNRITFRDADGNLVPFALAGSSRALDALVECANRHLGVSGLPDDPLAYASGEQPGYPIAGRISIT